ncbi:cytochrome P450 [Cristinia sonorae]|uniref:Cytochrome P450 n=1 Tax=Cristinia sonorae TaxID=1940300 RepID=A0A8K0UIM4_9AGAR|nr:cytochrome P450 [Cristinia sonorae]
MADSSLLAILAALAAFLYLKSWLLPSKHAFPHIPAIGHTAPLLSLISSFHYLLNARDMVQQGYDKYKGRAFKVPELFRWMIIVTGPQLIEELRKAPDDQLSFDEAVSDSLQVDYTLGPTIHTNGYHIPIIRTTLTRNLGALFPDVRDELATAFTDIIPPTDEWTKVPALSTIMKVVCRTTNRIFVGLPLCRDPDYRELNIEFTVDVVKAAATINLFPHFLRPLAGRVLTPVPSKIRRAERHLRPIIEQRYKMMEELGPDYEGKPNDMLSWLMDEAVGEEKDVSALTRRILTVNFAAIHTSSMSFTHALYQLAAHPEWASVLREEVEDVVKKEGWTKQAMQYMRKVDSFMKESQRFHGLGSIVMTRRALQDFTFSDGTFVPRGAFVSAAATATHYDVENYDRAGEFDPWRFSSARAQGEGEGTKHQMVSTSKEYVPFGHGRHACPGRFFAANELKAMMAHVVVTYDVSLEGESESSGQGKVPDPMWVVTALVPNPTAKVLFRRRRG